MPSRRLTMASRLLLSLHLLLFCLTYILLRPPHPPPPQQSFLFSVSVNGETHLGSLLFWALYFHGCYCHFFPPRFFPPSLVCLARGMTVAWQAGSFLSFSFEASQHISLERAGSSREKNSCLVSVLLPCTPHYQSLPFFLFLLCPSFRFQAILLERYWNCTFRHVQTLFGKCRQVQLFQSDATTLQFLGILMWLQWKNCTHVRTHIHKLTVIFWLFIPTW